MGKISLEMQGNINPINLRQRYGDVIGNEVWFLLRVIQKDDIAINALFKSLDELSDGRKRELINAVWAQYYNKIASGVLGGLYD